MATALVGLERMDDAAAIVMGAAYLDHALELLLETNFKVPPTGEDRQRMFDGAQNAILGTFSAKVRMARALDLLSEKVYHDLRTISDIRNAVAHSLHRNVGFLHLAIVEDLSRLSAAKDNPIRHPAHIFAETVRSVFASFMEQHDTKKRFMFAVRAVHDQIERREESRPTSAPSPGKHPKPPNINPRSLK